MCNRLKFVIGIVLGIGLLLQVESTSAQLAGCVRANKEKIRILKDARKHSSNCTIRCKGCGCKGGPGYRRPPRGNERKGRCVSYASLVRDCGPPPHAKCTAECFPVVTGCRKPTEKEIQKATKTTIARRKRGGCGSRGGSGYRGPNGRCVGHKRLRKICGNPPTLRCKAENVPVSPEVQ